MGTELAIVEASNYAIMNVDNPSEVIEANLGTEQLKPYDLDFVKVPTGGGTSWTVPGIEGDETTKEIVGVIVYKKDIRAYWPNMGLNGPPQCSSLDCIIGIGDPGGPCKECPYSKFGSAVNDRGEAGRGQACKMSRLLFVLRPEDMLPIIVRVPPSSLEAIKKYMMRLTSKNIKYCGVMTRLSLDVEKNADGIKYAKIVPTVAGKLGVEEADKFFTYGQSMRSVFDSVRVKDVEEAAA